jgi:hypothetical protein
MKKWEESWDLKTIPDKLLKGERARRNGAIARALGRNRGNPHGTTGDKHGMAKINQVTADAIRRDYVAGDSQAELGRAYELHYTTIHKIVHGKLWKGSLREHGK